MSQGFVFVCVRTGVGVTKWEFREKERNRLRERD